jgi:cobalamin biosynthesis protein CobW
VHKVDGMDAAALEAVEATIRAEAPAGVKLVRASHGNVPMDVLLGLERAVEDVIDSRKTHHDEEEDHDHDEFDSVSLTLQVADRAKVIPALTALVQRHEIYRIKGFVSLPGAAMRLVVQGVGQRFDSYFDRAWRADELRATRLVFIGDHLDAATLQAELQAALA